MVRAGATAGAVRPAATGVAAARRGATARAAPVEGGDLTAARHGHHQNHGIHGSFLQKGPNVNRAGGTIDPGSILQIVDLFQIAATKSDAAAGTAQKLAAPAPVLRFTSKNYGVSAFEGDLPRFSISQLINLRF